MSPRTCPHCGVGVDDSGGAAAFCEQCGKALPAWHPTGPRVVAAGAFAATEAGQALQARDLARQARKAAKILFAVGIIYLALSTCVGVGLSMQGRDLPPTLFLFGFGTGGVLIALGFWARSSPLPAALCALLTYLTAFAIDMVQIIDVWDILDRVPEPQKIRLFIGMLIRVIIIVALAQAVVAGVRYRNLQLMQVAAPDGEA